MAVRATMAPLIASIRTLINDPAGSSQVFADQDIQDVCDEARVDYRNEPLEPVPTFAGSQISYLDYYHALGGWEDGFVLKQYLINTVTPSASEPIVGHFQFAASTLPPVYITGSLHDRYRAAADLLERWAAKWMMSYAVSVDGQSLQRQQVLSMMLDLAMRYREKARPHKIELRRSDLENGTPSVALGPIEVDRMASG